MANWKASVPILGFKLYTCRYKVTMPSELHRSFNLCWDPTNQIATPVPHPSLLLQFHELLASTHGVKPHLSFNPNQRGDSIWGRWPGTMYILQLFCWKLIFTNKQTQSIHYPLQMNEDNSRCFLVGLYMFHWYWPVNHVQIQILATQVLASRGLDVVKFGDETSPEADWNIPGGWYDKMMHPLVPNLPDDSYRFMDPHAGFPPLTLPQDGIQYSSLGLNKAQEQWWSFRY